MTNGRQRCIILPTLNQALSRLQLRQPHGFSYRHSRHMYDHSFSMKSWKTASLCSQSMFSAPSPAEPSGNGPLTCLTPTNEMRLARQRGQAALSAVSFHLGLFHTRLYRPIFLYRNWLCPIPQAKKGPERPTFSPLAFFIIQGPLISPPELGQACPRLAITWKSLVSTGRLKCRPRFRRIVTCEKLSGIIPGGAAERAVQTAREGG